MAKKFSRQRYTSRRTRFERHMRAYKLAALGLGIAVLWMSIYHWREIYDTVRIWFMR